MDSVHIQSKFSVVSGSEFCTRIYAGSHLSSLHIEVQEYFRTEQLVYFDLGCDHTARICSDEIRIVMNIFRTDTYDNCFSVVTAVDERFLFVLRYAQNMGFRWKVLRRFRQHLRLRP